jgi:hypothetical protein
LAVGKLLMKNISRMEEPLIRYFQSLVDYRKPR